MCTPGGGDVPAWVCALVAPWVDVSRSVFRCTTRPLGQGSVWEVRCDGMALVVKRPSHRPTLEREVRGCRSWGRVLCDRVPQILAVDEARGAFVMQAVEGVSAASVALEDPRWVPICEQLGEMCRHAWSQEVAPDSMTPREAVQQRVEATRRRVAAARPIEQDLDHALDQIAATDVHDLTRAMCHRDLAPHNLWIDTSPAGPVARIIDFGRASEDFVLYDRAILELWLFQKVPGLRTAFERGYGEALSARAQRQVRALARLYAINTHVRGLERGSEHLRTLGARWLQVLHDP